MADAFKLSVKGTYSANSDYSDPVWVTKFADVALTPDEGIYGSATATSGGITIAAADRFTTITQVIIRNEGSEAVTVGYTDSGGPVTPTVAAGGVIAFTDVTESEAITLAAASMTSQCKFVIVGT